MDFVECFRRFSYNHLIYQAAPCLLFSVHLTVNPFLFPRINANGESAQHLQLHVSAGSQAAGCRVQGAEGHDYNRSTRHRLGPYRGHISKSPLLQNVLPQILSHLVECHLKNCPDLVSILSRLVIDFKSVDTEDSCAGSCAIDNARNHNSVKFLHNRVHSLRWLHSYSSPQSPGSRIIPLWSSQSTMYSGCKPVRKKGRGFFEKMILDKDSLVPAAWQCHDGTSQRLLSLLFTDSTYVECGPIPC